MTSDSTRAGSALEPTRPDGPSPKPNSRGHTGRLVLTTSDPHANPHDVLMIETLADMGFIGAQLQEKMSPGANFGRAFRIGPHFLSLVTFAGCAVRIPSIPDEQSPFCHVRIPIPNPHPRICYGRNTRAPRCENCRERLLDWRERIDHWATHPHAGVTCPVCGETRPPWLWDWKQQGGFGRLFIEVEEVFPGEAIPTPPLFERLTWASGTGWRHFYVQD